jgi:hypothetical protein
MVSESGGQNMTTINYSDGRAVEVVLLARTESTLLVAAQGADDVMEISDINGAWVSADCEPVTIEFSWPQLDRKPKISETDCYCSHELAARLIGLLFADGSEDRMESDGRAVSQMAFGSPCGGAQAGTLIAA